MFERGRARSSRSKMAVILGLISQQLVFGFAGLVPEVAHQRLDIRWNRLRQPLRNETDKTSAVGDRDHERINVVDETCCR
jgi:hypothetical protein